MDVGVKIMKSQNEKPYKAYSRDMIPSRSEYSGDLSLILIQKYIYMHYLWYFKELGG